jgi:tetratricopeptide (TPR) repeat protein
VGGERPIPGVDFVLGDDFFNLVDMEFDYPKGVIRLFQPQDCKGVSLAYWDRNAHELAMEDEKKIVLPITVNGRAATALLDSGASSSVVSVPFAEKLGITPRSEGVLPSGCQSGFGADYVRAWVARFDTVTIGNETIRDPRLQISDYMPELTYTRNAPPEVILGTDFLKAHRVFVSRSQRKVWFTYAGGQVFPATLGLDCDDAPRGKDAAEVRAGLDKAIEANARDVKALMNRARLRMRSRDDAGALADLDVVIGIEPGNALARAWRSDLRASNRDYAGALADSDAAIAGGIRTAQMYLQRAAVRRVQGDPLGAIAEFDEAIKLEPRNITALRGRARQHYYARRFEAAEADFAAILDLRPSGFDAAWLSLARTHRKPEDKAPLEQALAQVKDDAWPAPVLRYLLGRVSRAELLAAAVASDPRKTRDQECEARYYIAARDLAEGRTAEARPLLAAARDGCPSTFIEHEAAVAELERLR